MGSFGPSFRGLVVSAVIVGVIAIGLYELICWLFSFVTIGWA